MKKTIITTTIFIFLVIFFIILKNETSKFKKKLYTLKAGEQAVNLTLGIYNNQNIDLKYFLGKSNLILAFFDETQASLKTKELLERFNTDFLSKRKDVIVFFLKKQDKYLVIEEKSDYFNLLYRTLYTKIPSEYKFKIFPTILVIDRYGIIKILYNGYSPTLIQDLKNSLFFIK